MATSVRAPAASEAPATDARSRLRRWLKTTGVVLGAVLAGFPGWWSAVVGEPPGELFGRQASFRRSADDVCGRYQRAKAGLRLQDGRPLRRSLERLLTERRTFVDRFEALEPPDRYFGPAESYAATLESALRMFEQALPSIPPSARVSDDAVKRYGAEVDAAQYVELRLLAEGHARDMGLNICDQGSVLSIL